MPSSIERFIYVSLFSFIMCGFMALGFFLIHDKILKDKLEINHDLHDIFENFPISQTITVVIDGEPLRALKGEGNDFEEAKAFCESNNAFLPKKKLEFQNTKTGDYWIDIEETSAVEDPELLKTLNDYEELSSEKNITVAITISWSNVCMYAWSDFLLNKLMIDEGLYMNEKMYNFQFICENDVFDELNRVKIINDYKIDCEQFQINSSFYQEHHLWNHTTENVTWVLEDRKRLISPDEHDRRLDAKEVFAIGFELRDRGEGVTGEDLEDKTGFKWCAGTKLKPQGIYWEDGKGFIIVEGYSRYNRQFLCIPKE